MFIFYTVLDFNFNFVKLIDFYLQFIHLVLACVLMGTKNYWQNLRCIKIINWQGKVGFIDEKIFLNDEFQFRLFCERLMKKVKIMW